MMRQLFRCVIANELACSSAAQAKLPLGFSQAAAVLIRMPIVPVDSSAARIPANAQSCVWAADDEADSTGH